MMSPHDVCHVKSEIPHFDSSSSSFPVPYSRAKELTREAGHLSVLQVAVKGIEVGAPDFDDHSSLIRSVLMYRKSKCTSWHGIVRLRVSRKSADWDHLVLVESFYGPVVNTICVTEGWLGSSENIIMHKEPMGYFGWVDDIRRISKSFGGYSRDCPQSHVGVSVTGDNEDVKVPRTRRTYAVSLLKAL